jgi:hypothetical protein
LIAEVAGKIFKRRGLEGEKAVFGGVGEVGEICGGEPYIQPVMLSGERGEIPRSQSKHPYLERLSPFDPFPYVQDISCPEGDFS